MLLGTPKLEPVFLSAWLLIGVLRTFLALSTREELREVLVLGYYKGFCR